MAETTGIRWCDATFNPWVGCAKVSPGCANCYAETLVTGRMGRPGTWGEAGVRERTSESNWAKPHRWQRLAEQGLLPDGKTRARHRPRVFCASLADVFEPRPELDPWRRDLFKVIEATPGLDWLLLTKRPEEARDWLRARYWPFGGLPPLAHMPETHGCPPDPPEPYLPNVWMGVSIENARFTWRADVLREIPAAVRFVSAEPLLGSLLVVRHNSLDSESHRPLDLTDIDQVIVGGESGGRDARPMHPKWARELRGACAGDHWCDCNIPELEGVGQHSPGCRVFSRPAFFFKQWGSWAPDGHGSGRDHVALGYDGRSHGRMSLDANPDALVEPAYLMGYMGPSPTAGGNRLDGAEWTEFPAPRQAVPA